MLITSIGYNWSEKMGFTINRPNGVPTYTVIFFHQPVQIEIDSKIIKTKPNAFIVYNINQPQWYRMPQDITHDWFHTTADGFPDVNGYGFEFGQIYYPNSPAKLINIFSQINSEFYSESPYRDRFISIKIEELLITCSQLCLMRDVNITSSTEENVRNTHELMLTEYKRNWSVDELSKNAAMSESRFYAVYKSIYGTSPINTLIKYRINIAKNLLSTKNYSVSEVAEEIGFTNIYHFIRYFKKETGITPGKYSKNA